MLRTRLPVPSPQSLLQITRSILLSYLELLHILVANPAGAEYGPKWEDLRDLFRNAHAILNQYRAWQGREALIGMMESLLAGSEKAQTDWTALEAQVAETLKKIADTEAAAGAVIQRDGLEMEQEPDEKETRALDGTVQQRVLRQEHNSRRDDTKKLQERRRMWALLGEDE